MKDKPLKERIAEVIRHFDIKPCCNEYLTDCQCKELTQAILTEIKKELPEKDYKVLLENGSYGDGRVDGYNAYHDEMMRRLGC
jgi:hypothetical protein